MKIHVDRSLCENHGQCELVAPTVFSLDDDGVLQYETEVHESLRSAVEAAADVCPVQALTAV